MSVTSVEERKNQSDSYTTLIFENSDSSGKYDYVVDYNADTIFRTTATGDKMFPQGRRAVKVVYKSGYSATPQDLKLACFDLVKKTKLNYFRCTDTKSCINKFKRKHRFS